jgi:hypothetical protein
MGSQVVTDSTELHDAISRELFLTERCPSGHPGWSIGGKREVRQVPKNG